MSHHKYDPSAIQRAKDRIAYCQKIIDNAKATKLGDKDAVKNAMDTIREMEFTARANVFALLKKGVDQGDALARFNLGLMQAYQDVLTLFEAPDEFIKQYEQDKIQDEEFLKEVKLYDQVAHGE